MWTNRVLWALLAVTLGLLQTWDSGAYADGATVAMLATAGIVVPALGLAVTTDVSVRVIALAAGFLILTWVRVTSPISLNGLHVGLIVPAFCILFVNGWLERRGQISIL